MHDEAARARHDAFDTAADPVDAAREMRLRAACASALLHTDGDVAAAAMWDRTLGLAAQAGDDTFDARALVGQWHTMLTLSDIHESLRYATRFERAAERRGDRSQRLPYQRDGRNVAALLRRARAGARAAEAATAELSSRWASRVRAGSARRRHDDARAHDAHAARGMQATPTMRCASPRSGRVRAAARPRSRAAWCWGRAAVPIALRYGDHDITSDYLATLRATASAHASTSGAITRNA